MNPSYSPSRRRLQMAEEQMFERNRALNERKSEVVRRAQELIDQQERMFETESTSLGVEEGVEQASGATGVSVDVGDGEADLGLGLGLGGDAYPDDTQSLHARVNEYLSPRRSPASASSRRTPTSSRPSSAARPSSSSSSAASRRATPSSQRPSSSSRMSASMKRQADLDAEVAGLGAQLGQEMSSQSMGAVAMLRAYKTKIKVLEEGLERLAQENSEKQHKLNQHELKSRGILDELTKSKKLHGSCKLELEKVRKNEASAASKVKQLTREIAGYKREASKTASARDQSVQQSKTLEVKLNRALFDVEKYKVQVSTLKKNSSGTSKEGERELKRVQLENKRLKQQKKELLTAFKKQFKLIDILKRQKMHIEAAKLLSFTEEEFVKALELDA